MENTTFLSNQIIADVYTVYYDSIFRYIYYKISNKEQAEDLAQDTFLHLLSYRETFCFNAMKFFVYTIARNLVIDYLRRYYKEREVNAYLQATTDTEINDVESNLCVGELSTLERVKLHKLPSQRRKVYMMSRFQYKTIPEISFELRLSRRTVENHLFLSRKEIRTYISRCI